MRVRFALILSALFVASAASAESAAVAAAVAADAPAAADALPPECGTFAWDVSNELAVLQSPSTAGVAGTGGDAGAVRIGLGTRYDMRLHPQSEVTLAARPAKPMLDDGAMAGLLAFTVPADGRYRVSITTGHWIDVVDAGEVVTSVDFQGRRGCPLVHKIVEFDLRAGRELVLQFAGGSADETGLVITPVSATAR